MRPDGCSRRCSRKAGPSACGSRSSGGSGLHPEYRAQRAALLGRTADALRLQHQATSEGVGFGTERHQAAEFHGLKGYAPFYAFMRPKG